MAAFRCATCGKEHDELPLDLGYDHPADFFRIPPSERDQRVQYNEDLCSIDKKEHYARGILALPIRDANEEFRWGVWARIHEDDLNRYLALWNSDAAAEEPPFPGVLSGGITCYPKSDGLVVQVKLMVRQRPRFFVLDQSHELGIAQRDGVSWDDVHRFLQLVGVL
jgi:hypothetical protein